MNLLTLPGRPLGYLLLALLLALLRTSVLACEQSTPCGRCAKEPSISGNPGNGQLPDGLKRFYSLEEQIESAYRADDFVAARKLAHEYLGLADNYGCDWNYGNAVHDANRYLGLIALRTGNREGAVAYLLKAGQSTGSPQLNTFGPELDLADALLKTGEIDAVRAYLKDIRRFWEMDNGQVAVWLAEIERGEKPHLNRFAKQQSIGELLLYWFILAWPTFVVAGVLYSSRHRLSRKWLFGLTSLAAGYVSLVATGWSAIHLMPRVVEALGTSGASMFIGVMYVYIGLVPVVPLLVVFGISRLFVKKQEAR